MFRKSFLLVISTLALVTMACGLTINIPVDNLEPGPMEEKEIFVEKPDAEIADVTLSFGAGKLMLSPGVGDYLISGIAEYNLKDFEPQISVQNDKVRIETGDIQIDGVPKIGDNIKNSWDLKLGQMPMALTLNAGAYEGNIELGGLALKTLEVADGAADVHVKFSEPNPVEMDTLRYITGASNVRLTGLGNANFASMLFRSGAGDYTLDFSGELLREATVTIESGISQVTIVVPEGMNTKVYFKGGLASVNVGRGWQQSGDQYVIPGDGPLLIIHVDLGAGNLELQVD